MTDIHAHILPGVDDGAATLDEAVDMMCLAAEAGTTRIIATPHSDLRYRFDPQVCQELVSRLREASAGGPTVSLGCEVHLTVENVGRVVENPQMYTLNGGDCLLLELPDSISPAKAEPAIQALENAGLRVIIAHPERNRYIQKHPTYAERLVELGCFLQLTARSLDGGFGSAAASASSYLLKHRLAHFVSSDAHGAKARRPGLSAVYERISRLYGQAAAQLLTTQNPDAVLSGMAIQQMPVAHGWLNALYVRTTNAFRKQIPHLP